MQLTTNAMSLPNRQAKAHQDLRPPNAFLMMLEGRAPWEWAAMLAAAPWLYTLPRGDGHPVLVFPGLGATDFTTAPLRAFLRSRGYVTYAWKQGFNFGPRHGNSFQLDNSQLPQPMQIDLGSDWKLGIERTLRVDP